MTHAELVGKILAKAADFGLLTHYCPDSRRCDGPAGFPDVVVVGKHIIFREIKTGSAETTAEQDLWGWHLFALGSSPRCPFWAVWREADWDNGTIERELSWLSGPAT